MHGKHIEMTGCHFNMFNIHTKLSFQYCRLNIGIHANQIVRGHVIKRPNISNAPTTGRSYCQGCQRTHILTS